MYNNDSNPLADKKTIIGIALAMIFLVGWQYYLSVKYPKPVSSPVAPPSATAENVQPAPTGTVTQGTDTAGTPVPVAAPEQTLSFGNDDVRFSVSSHGMGLSSFEVMNYKTATGEPIPLGRSPEGLLFQIRWADGNPLNFELRELAPGHFEGLARVEEMVIRRDLRYIAENRSFSSRIEITNPTDVLSKGLVVVIPETIRRNDNASWFFPSYDHQDFFIFHSGTTDSVNFNHTKDNIQGSYERVSIASVGDQYFASAILDRSSIAPELVIRSNAGAKTALAELIYKPTQLAPTMTFEQILYAGSKSIDHLKAIDPELSAIVDFGMMTFIAKPFLYVMKWFYSVAGNWGVAIILLTLLVRLIVLPLHMMSLRSMKGMQKIQPMLQALREKHKDDPMAVHRETMALMKQHNANPLGGCLPMLLQIPIFFALFRVIGSSVELYQSPFVGWIKDLSLYDPFYVFPVLLGILMWLQQKMTPTNMDPAQAKIMAFLPLVFTVFMLQLPSGLTLYMVVSAIFGIVQQWFVLRENKATAAA